jgi:hypothetical protein
MEYVEGRCGCSSRGLRNYPRGPQVNDGDDSQGENLQESARETNSNLQRLIEAIGGLLAASGDLLSRLQHILSAAQPAATGSDEPSTPDHCDG